MTIKSTSTDLMVFTGSTVGNNFIILNTYVVQSGIHVYKAYSDQTTLDCLASANDVTSPLFEVSTEGIGVNLAVICQICVPEDETKAAAKLYHDWTLQTNVNKILQPQSICLLFEITCKAYFAYASHIAAGNEYSSAGNEYSSAGNEYSSAGNEYSSAGNEYSSAGNEYSSAGVYINFWIQINFFVTAVI
ncbi:hypothetical protein CHS0354_027531 [Potamilus streckersoni]|uniref:Uncharacterized protein n=1 Tax=Potamilus streckersoni TaxID=2493646 RepID=A0AAE0S0V9_9BIVA|nr:hypothetical protein CHS0354_027531 [Potamilus streckersoni]